MMTTNPYYTIDLSLHPIVIVRISSIDPTQQDFHEYMSAMLSLVKTMKDGVLIFNISEGRFLSSEKRIEMGNFYKENGEVFREYLKGFGFVNSAFIPMTILKGIFLITKPPVDYTIVSNEEDAIKWAKEKIARAN